MTMEESSGKRIVNPVCTTDEDLPDPPSNGELCDPAEPHPDEPGIAAEDAPPRRIVNGGARAK
jgi:hypothetical protein